MLRAFLKDSIVYTVPSLISRGLALLLLPVYTRVLCPTDYGSLDLLIVFGTLVNLIVSLEISQGLAYYFTPEKDGERRIGYSSSAFWFTISCYLGFCTLLLACSGWLAPRIMGQENLETAFQIGALYISLNGVFLLIQNQFRWELRSIHYAATSIITAFLTAILSVTLAFILKWGLIGILWGMLLGTLSGCVYGVWHLRSSIRFRINFNQIREMLFFSLPLVFSGVAVFVSTFIDRVMIKHFLSLYEVGLYGVGFRVASIAGLILIGFQGALMPLLYKHWQEADTPFHLARIFRVFVALALIVYLGLTLFSNEILAVMTTPNYFDASKVVIFLVPSILLSQMYIFAPGIWIAKQTHLILWINLMGACLNTALNWFMIPIFGIRGAALATLTGHACVFAVHMSFSQRLYRAPHQWVIICAAVLITISFPWIVSIPFVEGCGRILLNAAVLVGGLCVVFLTGLIRAAEFRQLYGMARDKIYSSPDRN